MTGGTFFRDYDGETWTGRSKAWPASVSDFRLDKYEITVGRFRKFVAAWDGGWRPRTGSGKHTHLNGNKGLIDSAAPGTVEHETGWDAAWTENLATDAATWATNLKCDAFRDVATWTPSEGGNEVRPINCTTWFESYAFCIWDGGFLPSEAEWNYAAAGGSEQRLYPWGAAPLEKDASLAVWNCYFSGSCKGVASIAPVGSAPAGNGKYGQANLVGNLFEWTLDWYQSPHAVPCSDCSYLSGGELRAVRGGGFSSGILALTSRSYYFPTARFGDYGARCARSP